MRSAGSRLDRISRQVSLCTLCPRLVAWRTEAAANPPAAYAGERYWARPLPGWGDPSARLVVVGLAPAANGGNRTGRMFTGDRSGDFLFAAMYRAGYANQPLSRSVDDGLRLSGAWVTAAVRCAPPANKPAPQEKRNCLPYLAAELRELSSARVILALGGFAYEALLQLEEVGTPLTGGRRARFAHGLELALPPVGIPGHPAEGRMLLCSYHPSQRNVFTGLLTSEMFDGVLARARELGG